MSVRYLNTNDGALTPLDTVKRISQIDEIERQSLSKLGPHVDATRFNTKIETADGGKSYAPETVKEISQQGVSLVAISDTAYVPTENITKARNITDRDRQRFNKSTGRAMSAEFQSQIETKAGTVLATVCAETVLDRRASMSASKPSEQPHEASEAVNMTEARDQVMSQTTSTQSQSSTPEQVQNAELGREL